ncbi:hypothetical protein [Pseudomonas mosselii]|uniref:hypothetical protein n=1 Tax=Pseudomonas mosselii TaxID=78327 RepID=UPI00300C59C0
MVGFFVPVVLLPVTRVGAGLPRAEASQHLIQKFRSTRSKFFNLPLGSSLSGSFGAGLLIEWGPPGACRELCSAYEIERRPHGASLASQLPLQDAQLGRATNLAEVRPDLPMQPAPLLPLFDAKLSGMATLGFVLSGFEVIDGCTYAQSWWCRFE